MPETQDEILEDVVNAEYKYGFVTNIDAENGRWQSTCKGKVRFWKEEDGINLKIKIKFIFISALELWSYSKFNYKLECLLSTIVYFEWLLSLENIITYIFR